MKPFVFICILLLSFSLAAQDFTRRDSLQGSLPPERTSFDVQRYHLNITINPENRTVAGYNDITLDVPFVWDGTSNLLIEICTGPSNPFSSPWGGVAVSTGIASGSRFYRTDGSSACGVATSSTNSHKPLCRLTWAPVPSLNSDS